MQSSQEKRNLMDQLFPDDVAKNKVKNLWADCQMKNRIEKGKRGGKRDISERMLSKRTLPQCKGPDEKTDKALKVLMKENGTLSRRDSNGRNCKKHFELIMKMFSSKER